jgi:hypothetical protein
MVSSLSCEVNRQHKLPSIKYRVRKRRHDHKAASACHSETGPMGITNLHNAGMLQEEVLASLKELDRLNHRKAATLAMLAESFARLVHDKLVPGAFVNITDFNGGAYKAKVIHGTHVQNTPIFRIDQPPVITVDDRPLNSSWTTIATPIRVHGRKPYFTAVTLQGYVFQGRAAIDDSLSENENILHHFSLWQQAQPSD